MKIFSKNKIWFGISVLVFIFLLNTDFALAQSDGVKPVLAVKIGNEIIDFGAVNCDPGTQCTIPWIGKYIGAIYNYGVGVAVILATIMIMIGGFIWLASAGSPNQISTAKNFITSALSGLLLALFSFIILQGVNPELVNLKPILVTSISPASIGASEGVGTPTSPSGANASTVPLGTNSSLAQIPGNDQLTGARAELSNTMDEMISQLAQSGDLPAGLQITSGFRPGDSGSQHALGTAVDFWWPGIDLESAHAFERAILNYNSNLTVFTEVRGDPDFQYFRGSGDGVVHIDMRNILRR